LEVERDAGGSWQRVADDGDWSTKLHWRKQDGGGRITVTWDVPADAEAGDYRVRYHGDAAAPDGRITPFTGTSPTFAVI
ncbi:MAG: neutral/alkaline non-lysosomal ceramidase C-terminal domain-containing protein, partial [Mycobacteriales bacterium]